MADRPARREGSRSATRDRGPGADGAGEDRRSRQEVPGGEAEKPTQIPAAGWKEIVVRAYKDSKDDQLPLLASGVAFRAFLALFPALIAVVTVYGLVSDPQQVQQQISNLASGLPENARSLLTSWLQNIAGGGSAALSWGLVLSLLAALWSASSGVQGLISATNIAYDEDESRGFVKLRATALVLTLGAVVFVIVAVGLITVVPALLGNLGLGVVGRVAAQVGRWVLLALFVLAALAVVYRYAPDRDHPQVKWASLGAVVATVLWLLGSAAFSLYVSNFGSYANTYGALAGVVVLLLWLFLTAYVVLFGAEINAEAEHQTAADTTRGEARPMGEREAAKADTMPGRS